MGTSLLPSEQATSPTPKRAELCWGISSSELWDPLPPFKILDDLSQPWHHCSSHSGAQHEAALSALILPVQESCLYIYKAFSQLLPSCM